MSKHMHFQLSKVGWVNIQQLIKLFYKVSLEKWGRWRIQAVGEVRKISATQLQCTHCPFYHFLVCELKVKLIDVKDTFVHIQPKVPVMWKLSTYLYLKMSLWGLKFPHNFKSNLQ